MKIENVLISVSDKTGIIELATELRDSGSNIISTGGTAKYLKMHGIECIPVEDITFFPEMMDGRLKTLHPIIFGGILGRAGIDDASMSEYSIPFIDMVVVNLYPFQQTVDNPESTHEDIIENIDIGGPSLLRAAAKNYKRVVSLCNPKDYPNTINYIKNKKSIPEFYREVLAQKVFTHTYQYDLGISRYFLTLG